MTAAFRGARRGSLRGDEILAGVRVLAAQHAPEVLGIDLPRESELSRE